MSDGSSNAPEQSPDSPPSDSATTPPPPSDSTPLSPPPSDSSPTLVLSPPPPEAAAATEQPPPTMEAQPSPPPPESGGGGDDGGNVGQAPPVPAAQVVGPAPPGGGPREVPRLAPPRASDNQPSSTTGNEVSTPASTSNNSHGNSNNTALIIGVVALGGILLLLVIVCVLCGRKKKKQPSHGPPYGWEGAPKPHQGNQYWQSSGQEHAVKIPPASGGWGQHSGGGVAESGGLQTGGGNINTSLAPSPSLTLGYNKSSFSYEELAAATNNFDKSRMLGQGGFGYVHKGTLPNGKEIAVKSLKSGSGQGEREFQSEVEIISRVHHRHLVSLVGYCIAGGQRMLVYEFVPNDTLEFHLHKKDPPLDFPTRLRIALGSAKGLSYLHEDCHPRIIHRDIKASNILLDENFEGMVADFGLAKLTTDTNTHVSTRVMGTFGYLAPEYASSGKLTEKSDVFSYGVMLLELITGRRPVDPNMKYMEDSLVDWSRPLLAKALETGNYDELADPRLERIYNPQEMQRMVACAAASIRHSAKKRPKMSQIVRALEGDVSLEDLNEGTRGGQSAAFSSSEGGSDYDTRQYNADLKKFRQMAFETQDFASKEHGGNTNDYGLNQSSSSENSREINDKLHRPF